MMQHGTAYRKQHAERIRLNESKTWHRKSPAEKQRITLWQNHKLTPEVADAIIARQQGRCLGCMKPLQMGFGRGKRFHVDHDHTCCPSIKSCGSCVRGFLCHGCNTAIGLVDESPETLRRLIAYLERDPKKYLVYIAGALKNPRIPEIGNILRKANYDAMDEWYTPGEHADANWQAYEKLRGRTFKEALNGRAATNIYLFDRAYIDLCDAFVAVLPFGKSASIELGYVKGLGKPLAIFTDNQEPDRYDVMPRFVDAVLKTEDELLVWLQTTLPGGDHR